MDNMMKVFNNSEFGDVRVMMKESNPWFVAADVCRVLDVGNPSMTLTRLDEDEKGINSVDTLGGSQDLLMVSEAGLYKLMTTSRKPQAKAFTRWVTHEVLPSIRATGAYMTDDAIAKFLADPDATIKLMVAYRDTAKALTAETQAHGETKMLLAERDATIKENEPKVLFADAVADSDGCISIGELAKIIAQNGVDIGRNRLFKLLRDDGYLMCGMTEDFNTPTQKSIRHGWMRVKESTYYQGNNRCIQKTPRITGKGQLYFVNKYAKKVG